MNHTRCWLSLRPNPTLGAYSAGFKASQQEGTEKGREEMGLRGKNGRAGEERERKREGEKDEGNSTLVVKGDRRPAYEVCKFTL